MWCQYYDDHIHYHHYHGSLCSIIIIHYDQSSSVLLNPDLFSAFPSKVTLARWNMTRKLARETRILQPTCGRSNEADVCTPWNSKFWVFFPELGEVAFSYILVGFFPSHRVRILNEAIYLSNCNPGLANGGILFFITCATWNPSITGSCLSFSLNDQGEIITVHFSQTPTIKIVQHPTRREFCRPQTNRTCHFF